MQLIFSAAENFEKAQVKVCKIWVQRTPFINLQVLDLSSLRQGGSISFLGTHSGRTRCQAGAFPFVFVFFRVWRPRTLRVYRSSCSNLGEAVVYLSHFDLREKVHQKNFVCPHRKNMCLNFMNFFSLILHAMTNLRRIQDVVEGGRGRVALRVPLRTWFANPGDGRFSKGSRGPGLPTLSQIHSLFLQWIPKVCATQARGHCIDFQTKTSVWTVVTKSSGIFEPQGRSDLPGPGPGS